MAETVLFVMFSQSSGLSRSAEVKADHTRETAIAIVLAKMIETGQAMYLKRNTAKRSRNQCYRGNQ